MIDLPNWIRGIPRAVYFAAGVWLGWSIFYALSELGPASTALSQLGNTFLPKIALAEYIFRAALDSVFLLGTGVTAQILIHIHDVLAKRAPE